MTGARLPRPCSECGNVFEPTGVGQKVCGEPCRRLRKSRLAMERIARANKTRICEFCGEHFKIHPTRPTQKYCGSVCANRATASVRGAAVRGPRPHLRVERKAATCARCGKGYEILPSETRKGRGRYCSVDCFHEQLRDYARPKWKRANVVDVRRKFNLKLKGEKSCRNCGKPAEHLHHAIPRSMSREAVANLLNGLPLCAVCHQGWHYRTVTIHREVFTADEWEYLLSVSDTGRVIGVWLEDRYPERISDIEDENELRAA